MLQLENVHTAYGASEILFGVSLHVGAGEVVSLMGRNGMGKTTTVRSIMGLTPPHAGDIRFAEQPLTGLPAHRIARAGLGLVPEGRRIFPNLSVRENLVATAANHHGQGNPWTLDRVFDFFPRLAERQRHWGNQLSGGEQQMLAIGRALLTNPKLLILDEACEGLAPLLQQEIWNALAALKAEGLSILVIDKDVRALLAIADRHYILEKGQVVWQGDSAAFQAEPQVQQRYLGL